MFQKWETLFSNRIFQPLCTKDISKFSSEKWLLKFAVSVSWRALYYYKNHLELLSDFTPQLIDEVNNALNTWEDCLFDRCKHPGKFEQHMFFVDLIDGCMPNTPSNINRYNLTTSEVDVGHTISGTEAFVWIKMLRVILIGFIEIKNLNNWLNTKIHVNKGIVGDGDITLPGFMKDYYFERVQKTMHLNSKISDIQKDKISKDYKKNMEKFANSNMFKAMEQDALLFGKNAFTNNEP